MKPTKRNETKHECCRGLSDPLSSFLLGGFENEKVRNDASGLGGRGDASERRRLIIALSQRLSSAVPQFRSSARSCAPQARKGAPFFCRACARRAAGSSRREASHFCFRIFNGLLRVVPSRSAACSLSLQLRSAPFDEIFEYASKWGCLPSCPPL